MNYSTDHQRTGNYPSNIPPSNDAFSQEQSKYQTSNPTYGAYGQKNENNFENNQPQAQYPGQISQINANSGTGSQPQNQIEHLDPKSISKNFLSKIIVKYQERTPQSFQSSFRDIYSGFYGSKIALNLLFMNFVIGLMVCRRKNWFKLTTHGFRAGLMGFGGYFLLSFPFDLRFNRQMNGLIDKYPEVIQDLLVVSRFRTSLYLATERRMDI